MHMHQHQPQFRSRKSPESLKLGMHPQADASEESDAFELEPPAFQFGDDMAILIENIFEAVDVDAPAEN
ncbi:unannotated protein [freshwater metagenome]|uniref:Unannotated protein n=1 Tax=freshwater metagenome TaxID=449393 RepID=A0A6J6CNC0_9ZZZZ